jgi:hypothetical protein
MCSSRPSRRSTSTGLAHPSPCGTSLTCSTARPAASPPASVSVSSATKRRRSIRTGLGRTDPLDRPGLDGLQFVQAPLRLQVGLRGQGQFVGHLPKPGGGAGGDRLGVQELHSLRRLRVQPRRKLLGRHRRFQRRDQHVVSRRHAHRPGADQRENRARVEPLAVAQRQRRARGDSFHGPHQVVVREEPQVALDGKPYHPSLRQAFRCLSTGPWWAPAVRFRAMRRDESLPAEAVLGDRGASPARARPPRRAATRCRLPASPFGSRPAGS